MANCSFVGIGLVLLVLLIVNVDSQTDRDGKIPFFFYFFSFFVSLFHLSLFSRFSCVVPCYQRYRMDEKEQMGNPFFFPPIFPYLFFLSFLIFFLSCQALIGVNGNSQNAIP